MKRSVIRKVAKQNGVSVAEVRREMQIAIESAYANPNAAALAVPRKNTIPTPEEFIDYCVNQITSRPSDVGIGIE